MVCYFLSLSYKDNGKQMRLILATRESPQMHAIRTTNKHRDVIITDLTALGLIMVCYFLSLSYKDNGKEMRLF